MYCTVTWFPACAVAPVPVIRSCTTSWLGRGPDGTTTDGSVPKVPADDHWMLAGTDPAVPSEVEVAAEEEVADPPWNADLPAVGDREELQAARPSPPARAAQTTKRGRRIA